jgi:hypothetical protein
MAFRSHASTSCGLVSLSWCLLRACCSRRRVVYDTELQRRIESLYPRGVATCFHAAFTAHRADAGSRQLQALVRQGCASGHLCGHRFTRMPRQIR